MAIELAESEWATINDAILSCNILEALKKIRELCGVGLNEAKDIHWERYQQLRKERPGDFTCSHDEYWAEVYG